MSGLVRKSLDSPDETRPFEGGTGQLEVVLSDGGAVGRASGRMKVVMDDGEQMEYGPGDFAVMAPGHDAWIIGDEPCVVIDWQGYADYAKR